MMEQINLSITPFIGHAEEKPLPKTVSGDEVFKNLLMSQQPGTEEKDTRQNGSPIEVLIYPMIMEVLTGFVNQNNAPPSDTLDPQALKDPIQPANLPDHQGPSSLNDNLKGSPETEILLPSFNLDAVKIPEQGAGSPLITSSLGQVPFTPNLSNETPVATILPEPATLSADEADISTIGQLFTSPMRSEQIENDAQADPLPQWGPTYGNQGTLFRESDNSKQEATMGVIPQNINPMVPGPSPSNQNDQPIEKILAHSFPQQEASLKEQKTILAAKALNGHLNSKAEAGTHILPFQGDKGEENLRFDPPGLKGEIISPSLGVELQERGKILFDESGPLLRSGKEDQQNSGPFVLLNDQKGNPGSNPITPEEVQKGHEPFILKAESTHIYQQIGQKVIWSLKNNEEKIKLSLDPPDLGNIYMEINRGKENIRATLWTDNPATKEILEAHQTQLYRLLKDDGFKLEKYDVFLQQDMGSFQNREEQILHPGLWARDESKEDKIYLSLEALEISPTLTSRFIRGNNHIDLFV